MFSDEDTLILKNPFNLLKSDTEVVHIMYDFVKYSNFKHPNFLWLRSWNQLSYQRKGKCGLKDLKMSIFDKRVNSLHPLNSGLMIGKVKYLLRICELISSIYKCVGMFRNNAEQGLLNYLFISGQLDEIGMKFYSHTVENGLLISCPNYLSVDEFDNRINSGEIYALHHYHWLQPEYVNRANEKVKKLILYVIPKI